VQVAGKATVEQMLGTAESATVDGPRRRLRPNDDLYYVAAAALAKASSMTIP